MSKLRCVCDHIIRDQTDNLPYKARFLPDEDHNAVLEAVAANILQFMLARERGDQGAFIHEFLGGVWSDDEDPATILNVLLTDVIFGSRRLIYECENCGRIWVQKHAEYDKNIFVSYSPESNKRQVLRSQRRRQADNPKDD